MKLQYCIFCGDKHPIETETINSVGTMTYWKCKACQKEYFIRKQSIGRRNYLIPYTFVKGSSIKEITEKYGWRRY